MKTRPILINTLQAMVFALWGCHNSHIRCDNCDSKIQAKVAVNRKDSTIWYLIKNSDNRNYFVLQNPQIRCSNDTFYIESAYTRHKQGSQIKINQFNPPIMTRLPRDSSIENQVSYKGMPVSMHWFVAIRVYTANYPYHAHNDYVNYHSIGQFLSFEQKNSFLLILK